LFIEFKEKIMNDRIYYSREAELKAQQKLQQERFMIALIVLGFGLSIGAVIALLFAPLRGNEARQAIAHQAGNVYDSGREATNKAVEGLQKDFDRLRKEIDDRLPL
jgi:gas vesicle protein